MSNRPNTRSRSATAEKSKKIDEPSKKKALHTRQGAVAPSGGGATAGGSGGGGGGGAKWIWIGLAAAVAVVLVVAVVIVRSRGGNDSTALVYGNVTVTGTPLPEQPQGQSADPAVGQTIPTLVGQNFEGQKTEIAPNGKPKVVMFLAHWCPHCQAEVPRVVQELKDKGTPTDVEIFAVPTGTDQSRTNFPPAKWLKRENLTVPVLVDTADGKAAKAYGIGGFPYFVVVGADGKVVQRTSGELAAGQFSQLLNAARSGAPGATTGTAGASSPVPGNG